MRTAMRYLLTILLLLFLINVEAASEEYTLPFDEEALYSRLDRYEKRRYEGLRYLLNDQQKRQYLSMPSREERDEWVAKFWKLNDPTPATVKNERRFEHEERVRSARELYPKEGFPGWDHRGEALIRFGPSDRIVEIEPNLISAESVIEDFNLKMPGQVWHYDALGMVIPFEQVNLDGEYNYYMELSTISSREMTEMSRHSTKNGGGPAGLMLSEAYSQLLESNMYSSSNIYNLDFAAVEPLLRFYSLLEGNMNIHSADYRRVPLPCYFDITAFKGGGGKVRTEVNFEIPARELSYEVGTRGFKTDFEMKVAVYDLNMEEVVSGSDLVDIDLPERPGPDSPWLLPAQFILTLDPGYYRFGLEVRDRRNKKHGAFLVSRQLPLLGDTLCISDIQLASSIEQAGTRSSFVKGPLRVIPHPVHAYRKPDPVRFYFEIYGLDLDDEDFGFWEVEYEVEPRDKKREGPVYKDIATVMSSKFSSSGFGSTQRERLEIDSGELWEGSFRLKVRVMDRRTRRTAETVTNFSILD